MRDSKRVNCFTRVRESNSGATSGQQTRPRAGAPTWVSQDKRLRLRKEGEVLTMSYKNQAKHTIDGTIEIEFGIDDLKKAEAFLEVLGYPAYRHQEKFRHTFELQGVVFDIDTWPRIPTYVELEGNSEESIRKMAELVGYD